MRYLNKYCLKSKLKLKYWCSNFHIVISWFGLLLHIIFKILKFHESQLECTKASNILFALRRRTYLDDICMLDSLLSDEWILSTFVHVKSHNLWNLKIKNIKLNKRYRTIFNSQKKGIITELKSKSCEDTRPIES